MGADWAMPYALLSELKKTGSLSTDTMELYSGLPILV